MPTLNFTDPRQRLRRALTNALEGCLVQVIREEEGRRLVVEANRPEGQHVAARFLGVQTWKASSEPAPGSRIHLKGVGGISASGWLALLNPFRQPMPTSTRVRIGVGAATLEIECQDVEWWQDEAVADEASAT
jgi:hypothetical protein